MVEGLFRMAFLLLYAAAWLLVVATLLALNVLVAVARFLWTTLPPLVARIRTERRIRRASVQERAALVGRSASLH
jgi:heme/copper-type cytochrome/quinol oxidase subunit 1